MGEYTDLEQRMSQRIQDQLDQIADLERDLEMCRARLAAYAEQVERMRHLLRTEI